MQRKSIWSKRSITTNLIQSNYDVLLFTFPGTRISWNKSGKKTYIIVTKTDTLKEDLQNLHNAQSGAVCLGEHLK